MTYHVAYQFNTLAKTSGWGESRITIKGEGPLTGSRIEAIRKTVLDATPTFESIVIINVIPLAPENYDALLKGVE